MDDLTRPEADKTLQRFLSLYRHGDLNGFMSLFAKQARSNDGGLRTIRSDYAGLFRNTTERSFEVNNVRWTFEGRKATARGRFVVRVRERPNAPETRYTGSLRIELSKNTDGQVLIEGLFHQTSQ